MQDLVSQGVDVTIQAVGIQVGSSAEAALTCAANASGGEYFGVDDLDHLADAIGSAVAGGPTRWVAMGDSFSSGEGALWFYEGTNERGEDNPQRNECRRSDAYASLANQAIGLAEPEDFLFVACSGARITDVLGDSDRASPGFQGQYPQSPYGIHGGCRQLEYLLISGEEPCQGTGPDPSIDVVTLTIGGNDFGFSEILLSCIGFKGPELRLLDGAVPQDVPWLLDFTQVADGRDWIALDQNCESYSHRSLGSFSAAVRDNITAVGADLENLYNEVQASAPNAEIYVLAYPMFIPSEFNRAYGDSCGGVAGLDGEERTWLRTITMHANNTIEQAAQSAGVTFVDVEQIEEDMGSPDGANHLICSGDPWHHGASTGDSFRGINVPFADNADHNRFHPMREAHVAMGSVLASCIQDSSACNPPTPWLYCNGEEATIYGTKGDDLIDLLAVRNVVVALDGNDGVVARFGNDDDVICGGAGFDKLSGGDGNDYIAGGPDPDYLWGDEGNDIIYGGDGNDIIHGKNGDDFLYGEAGDDVLHGGRSNGDYCDGGPGNDETPGSYFRSTCETEVDVP